SAGASSLGAFRFFVLRSEGVDAQEDAATSPQRIAEMTPLVARARIRQRSEPAQEDVIARAREILHERRGLRLRKRPRAARDASFGVQIAESLGSRKNPPLVRLQVNALCKHWQLPPRLVTQSFPTSSLQRFCVRSQSGSVCKRHAFTLAFRK